MTTQQHTPKIINGMTKLQLIHTIEEQRLSRPTYEMAEFMAYHHEVILEHLRDAELLERGCANVLDK